MKDPYLRTQVAAALLAALWSNPHITATHDPAEKEDRKKLRNHALEAADELIEDVDFDLDRTRDAAGAEVENCKDIAHAEGERLPAPDPAADADQAASEKTSEPQPEGSAEGAA